MEKESYKGLKGRMQSSVPDNYIPNIKVVKQRGDKER